MDWKEIRRFRVGTADGETDDIILEKDEDGNFRIINDFGNESFSFERMAGYEFFKKLSKAVTEDLNNDAFTSWVDDDNEDPTVYDSDSDDDDLNDWLNNDFYDDDDSEN